MKVVFSFQKDSLAKPQKQSVVFGAGLTPKMMQEIQQADILTISSKLAKKGIPTDFKENKVIAWCCDKIVEIFEQLNKEFGQKLALPKGIFVEDFEKLNIDNPIIPGFLNPTRTNLIINSDEIIPAQTIFFNSYKSISNSIPSEMKKYYDWDFINEIADYDFSKKYSSTDFFLYYFLHEFSHLTHEDRLLNKMSSQNFDKKLDLIKSKVQIEQYHKKYGEKVSQICNNALENPFDAVACDMSWVIAESLDPKTLLPTRNPFIGTPYENLSFWQKVNIPNYMDEERPLNEILRRFWNGKFD